ncbi:MAG: hypothetical protein WAW73_19620 [Rhodoferax sp.]
MAIKIVVSDTVGIKVKGSINDAAGVPQAFDFGLTCKRLDVDQIQAKIKAESDASYTDFMVDVVTGWSAVRDADDKPEPYSEESFRQLCKIPGVAALSFRTYLNEVGAKEKN